MLSGSREEESKLQQWGFPTRGAACFAYYHDKQHSSLFTKGLSRFRREQTWMGVCGLVDISVPQDRNVVQNTPSKCRLHCAKVTGEKSCMHCFSCGGQFVSQGVFHCHLFLCHERVRRTVVCGGLQCMKCGAAVVRGREALCLSSESTKNPSLRVSTGSPHSKQACAPLSRTAQPPSTSLSSQLQWVALLEQVYDLSG